MIASPDGTLADAPLQVDFTAFCHPECMTFAHRIKPLLLGFGAGLVVHTASAQSTQAEAPEPAASEPQIEPVKPSPSNWSYVVGMTLVDGPPYPGAGFTDLKLRPLLAVKIGRWRLSTSHASSIMGFASDNGGAGASTDLFESKRWHFGLSLRIDRGRKSSEAPRLAGLPDIDQTLRARVYANYRLTPHWTSQTSASQDLLGRGGGLVLRQGVGYAMPFKVADMPSEWSVGLGVSWADRRQLKIRYGITPEQSQATGLPAFEPKAGWFDQSVGIGVTTAISPRWVIFASITSSALLGDAARSPLTLGRSSHQTSVGLAYRCCQ
jgi:MipA family protein